MNAHFSPCDFAQTEFAFSGSIPPSKSLLIRQLLLKLHTRDLSQPVLSECADVQVMHKACVAFEKGDRQIDCGEAGLVLRLCVGYASRVGGLYELRGSRRLMERPHESFFQVLARVGTRVVRSVGTDKPSLRVEGPAWERPNGPIPLLGGTSSQFASSLLLNAWRLPFQLELLCDREPVSKGYLEMSIDLCERWGMQIDRTYESDQMTLIVPVRQVPIPRPSISEADVSSAFAVAALAAVSGRCFIDNFPTKTLQPDHRFVEILSQMGVPLELNGRGLSVQKAARLCSIEVDLGGAPDLAPVLAVLCAISDGTSRIYGAPHLRGKESDRIASTCGLLHILGRACTPTEDGMVILGQPLSSRDMERSCSFDATGDHRLVMAGAVAQWAGFPINMSGVDAVHKSFPEFLTIAKLV